MRTPIPASTLVEQEDAVGRPMTGRLLHGDALESEPAPAGVHTPHSFPVWRAAVRRAISNPATDQRPSLTSQRCYHHR
jgi:hypothetical protein